MESFIVIVAFALILYFLYIGVESIFLSMKKKFVNSSDKDDFREKQKFTLEKKENKVNLSKDIIQKNLESIIENIENKNKSSKDIDIPSKDIIQKNLESTIENIENKNKYSLISVNYTNKREEFNAATAYEILRGNIDVSLPNEMLGTVQVLYKKNVESGYEKDFAVKNLQLPKHKGRTIFYRRSKRDYEEIIEYLDNPLVLNITKDVQDFLDDMKNVESRYLGELSFSFMIHLDGDKLERLRRTHQIKSSLIPILAKHNFLELNPRVTVEEKLKHFKVREMKEIYQTAYPDLNYGKCPSKRITATDFLKKLPNIDKILEKKLPNSEFAIVKLPRQYNWREIKKARKHAELLWHLHSNLKEKLY